MAEVPELGEIVVTATRQEQRLSRVPMSVAAFSQESLTNRNVRSVEDLTRLTPGLNLRVAAAAAARLDIRGISSEAGSATTGVYIDDTPIQARSLGFFVQTAFPALYDLERVEVLRGPQGTLFGAGSMGGTVRFITPDPSLSKSTAFGRAEVSSISGGAANYEIGLGGGIPLIEDKVAVRVSGFYRRDGGFIDLVDPFTGETTDKNANVNRVLSLKGALAVQLNDAIKVTPSIFYQRRKYDGPNAYWSTLSDPDDNRFVSGDRYGQILRDKFYIPSVKIEADLGNVNLISTTSYFYRKFDNRIDLSTSIPSVASTNSPFLAPGHVVPYAGVPGHEYTNANGFTQKNFTQEVRLSPSDPDRLNWLVGIFYNHAKQHEHQGFEGEDAEFVFRDIFGLPGFIPTPPNYQPGNYLLFFDNNSTDEQIAFFGNVDYNLTEKLKLTAGVRVAKVRNDFTNVQGGPINGSEGTSTTVAKATPITPKFGITYQADSRNMFYATAAKGFRLGGGNGPVLGLCEAELTRIGLTEAPATYDADSLWSYEIGAKNKLFGGRLQLDTSAYLIDWKNIQQVAFLPSCNFQYIANIGNARSKGFDLQASFRATDDLTLGASVGYNHSTYTGDVYPGPLNASTDPVIASKGDIVGNGSAPWNVVLNVQYQREFSDAITGYLNADLNYLSRNKGQSIYNNPRSVSYYPYINLPSSTVLNMRIGVRLSAVDLSVFASNLTNSHQIVNYFRDVPASPISKNAVIRPRTIGVTASFRR